MIKYRTQIRAVSNVAASKTALIDLPCGPRYHRIVLDHGYAAGTNTVAAACTNISEIRVKSNSRVQRVVSGTQLRDINLLNGTAFDGQGAPNTTPGVSLPIFFGEPWRETPADQDALAWATAGWLSFQIEVDLGAATTPTLSAWAIVDDFVPPANSNPGIVKWIRSSFPASGTSYDITTLDRRDFLQQITIYPDSGASNQPTPVTFKRNGLILSEGDYLTNNGFLINSQMTPTASGRTAGLYDIVFDHDGLLSSSIPMDGTRDVTLTIQAGSAMSGSQTLIIQRLGPPE
jgi:hypothetical protein